MILSEFAGAAQSLNGSIVVNPWDSQQVADAIYEAVTMDAETKAENHKKLFKVRRISDLHMCFRIYLSLWLFVVRYEVLSCVLGHVLRARDDAYLPPAFLCQSIHLRC